MAQSRVNGPDDEPLGNRASDLGAWDKLQLGWLDYETVVPPARTTVKLGPHEYNSAKPQAASSCCRRSRSPGPRRTGLGHQPVVERPGRRPGQHDDPDGDAGGRHSTLSLQARWNIEDCGPDPCDYAYVEVNAGTGCVAVAGHRSPRPLRATASTAPQASWTPATFDLSAYAGKTVGLRLRYSTDGAAGNERRADGIFVDDVKHDRRRPTLFTDGAEPTPTAGPSPGSPRRRRDDQSRTTTTTSRPPHYVSYDQYLQDGSVQLRVPEHQAGLRGALPVPERSAARYWDTSQPDNNTSPHPGSGLILPIDAQPAADLPARRRPWRPRCAAYDAPFSLEKSDSFTLHVNGVANYIRGQDAQPLFHDNASYWDASQPAASVKVPDTGTNIKVLSHRRHSMGIRIWKRG